MKKGILKQNGVHLEEHEWRTVKFFLEQGKDIELIPKSQIKNFHMGDIMMDGIDWEIKSPIGDGKYTVQNTMQTAVQQSTNIIIDLHRSKMSEEKAIRAFSKEFEIAKGAKRLKIICKTNEMTFSSKSCSIILQGVDLHRSYAGATPFFSQNLSFCYPIIVSHQNVQILYDINFMRPLLCVELFYHRNYCF